MWVNSTGWEMRVSPYAHEMREDERLLVEGRWATVQAGAVSSVVDYGDGSGEQAILVKADASFRLEHMYRAAGRYTPRVTVRDGAGHVATGFLTCNVLHRSLPAR